MASELEEVKRKIDDKEKSLALLAVDHPERVPLQQQLASLQEEKVLLMRAAAGAVGTSRVEGDNTKWVEGPVSLTPSSMIQNWRVYTTEAPTLASLEPDMTSWLSALSPASRGALIDMLKRMRVHMVRCGVEPDIPCYEAMGKTAKRLVAAVGILAETAGDSIPMLDEPALDGHRVSQLLEVQVNKMMKCENAGKRAPDYGLVIAGLGERRHQHLLQAGELLCHHVDPMEDKSYRVKFSQGLDHAGRVQKDSERGSAVVLPFEVSDGQRTRCTICRLGGGVNPSLTSGTRWQDMQNANELQRLQGAWLDKMVMAYAVYQRLLPHLAAAAEPRCPAADRCADLSPAVPVSPVVPNDVLEVEVQDACGSLRPTSPRDTAGQSDQLPTPRRHIVRVCATWTVRQLQGGGVAVVLAGALPPDRKTGSQASVVVRLCVTRGGKGADCQQVVREQSALMVLQGAGYPYLPRAFACGAVVAGPAGALGASAVLTLPMGEPLHRYVAWHRGARLVPRDVLLLAGCLSGACVTLLAAGVRHNDLCPRNITVSLGPGVDRRLFHVVDFGASANASLNSSSFRAAWGYTDLGDLSAVSPVGDLLFSSLEAIVGWPLQPQLLPLSDFQSAVYSLVFLASGSLPWSDAASRDDRDGAAAGREHALDAAEAWAALHVLPKPAAVFAGWVLRHATLEHVDVREVKQMTRDLFTAVSQEVGVALPWPALLEV